MNEGVTRKSGEVPGLGMVHWDVRTKMTDSGSYVRLIENPYRADGERLNVVEHRHLLNFLGVA